MHINMPEMNRDSGTELACSATPSSRTTSIGSTACVLIFPSSFKVKDHYSGRVKSVRKSDIGYLKNILIISDAT